MRGRQRRKSTTGDWHGVETLSPRGLRGWQLPRPSDTADKESRGRVLVVAGSAELPGTAILAATAALRAGAGKLRIATVSSIAAAVGVAVPEARVFSLPETEDSGIAPDAAEYLAELANGCQATLMGPGLVDNTAVQRLVADLLPRLSRTALILDSEAMMAAQSGSPHLAPATHSRGLSPASLPAVPSSRKRHHGECSCIARRVSG
jgi:ADP-dependent NAD(P)H-hydrate dehydratase